MADYTVRIEATTEEAERKLNRVDSKVNKLERGASIDIRVPNAQETLNVLGKITSTTATVAKQAFLISKAANIGPGAIANDFEDLFEIVTGGGKRAVSALDALRKATPTNILGTAFTTAADQATQLSRNLAAVGYEIFGLTQSVNILQQAFGGLFNETIGREIRLQESLLRTRTTLASTADVAVNGKRLTDPYEALMALEGPVDEALQNIRRRSLDIAGTTSDAIVQMFGVVAGQVGSFGGTMKDAEDLAITFAGALGTIGMADPTLAVQEVRSILTGTVDQNSVLARSLGLTNADIQKAKTSAEGLTAFLTRRLAAFTAGQKLAAQGFAGVVSNIEEIREEASRSLGKPLLQPLLDNLTAVYNRLGLVFERILNIADGIGRIGATAFSGLMSGIGAAPILAGFSERDQINAFQGAEEGIAKFAVRVQAEIDKVRPLIANLTNEIVKAIAMLVSGLAEIAKGFVSFKFERIKLLVQSITTIAQILNATIIPALSTVLNLYGQILSNDVFQWFARVQASMEVLEKIGIMPIIRTVAFFKLALIDSVKTVINWIKIGVDALKTAATAIVNTTATTIGSIGDLVTNIGTKVIQVVSTITSTIITIVGNVTRSISVSLRNIAVELSSSMNPAVQQLALVINTVSTAFSKISHGARNASAAVDAFSADAQLNMMRFGFAVDNVANKTRNLGTIIGTQLTAALKKVGGVIGNLVKGFIIFQLQMLAIQYAVGIITQIISDIQRAGKEIEDQTRAQLAIKRLSNEYANLGENASAAAKALKAANEAIVTNRIESVTKSYVELNDKLRELDKLTNPKNLGDYSKVLAAVLNPSNFDVKPKLLPDKPGFQETGLDALIRTRREQVQKLQQELENLNKFQAQNKQREDDLNNIEILARERKDIETALGEYRKEIEKELNDERFRATQELAKLEQSLKEEGRRAERAELERRLAREQQDLVGIQASIAQILGDYERGLFDAQTEAQRKQFEAAQARESLEKSIADYKLKLEEQTERMRKRMGDYNTKVVNYEAQMRERTARKVLEFAIKAHRVQVSGYIMGPNETNKFLDAAASAGASAEQIISFLYAGGANDIGVTTGANPKDVVSAVTQSPQFRDLQNIANRSSWETALNMFAKERLGQSRGGTFAIQSARDDFNLDRFYNKETPPPPKISGFADFKQEQAQFVSERRSLLERINALSENLGKFINFNNFNENLNKAGQSLQNPSLYTTLPAVETLNQEYENLTNSLRLFDNALKSGTTQISTFEQESTNFELMYKRAFDQFTKSSKVFQRRDGTINQNLVDATKKVVEDSLKLNVLPKIPQSANKARAAYYTLMQDFIQGLFNARDRIKASSPLVDRNKRVAEAAQEYQTFMTENKTMLRDSMLNAFESLSRLSISDSPLKARQLEADMINMRKQISYADKGLLQDPENVDLMNKEIMTRRATYTTLGEFETKMKNVTERLALAADLAKTFTDSYKNAFKAILQGGDLQEVFANLFTAINDKLIGTLLDYAFRPLENQMKAMFNTIFNVRNPEEIARKELAAANHAVRGAIESNNMATNDNTKALQALPEQISAALSKMPVIPYSQNQSGSSSSRTPATTTTQGAAQSLQAAAQSIQVAAGSQGAAGAAAGAGTSADAPKDPNAPKQQEQQQEQGRLLKDLNKGFAAATQAVVGVTLAMDGLRRVTESSSTYDTLMGIGSIFMGIGSVLGGINGLGKKAAGGPVHARQPYLVGEKGPELFYPETFGTVVPNATTAALLANRNALAGKSRSAAADVFAPNHQALSATATLSRERYVERVLSSGASSTEIKYSRVGRGDLPFVTEDDMLQATRLAAEQGARIGQQRTLAALRNDPSVRRGIAI